MNDDGRSSIITDFQIEFALVIKWVLSGVLQAFFVVCWVVVQWAVNNYVVQPYKLYGVDEATLTVAQNLFAVSTLAPILLFLVELVAKMIVRVIRNIAQEVRRK